MYGNEENIYSIASNITYEKLIKYDETKYEEILLYTQNKKKIRKIANDCIANLEKNILKNYSLLISIDKVCPLKENKIFDSKQIEEICYIFKKDFLESISNSNQNNKVQSKNVNLNVLPQLEQIEKRLEFLKFFIKTLTELKEYNILKEILIDRIFLNQEQKRFFIKQIIDEFKGNREKLFNKEEIKFYELLILEFNYLENNLDYKIKNIENDKLNYEIKLNKKIENIRYLQYINDFIRSFSKQKDKDVIEEMIIFLFNFFNSTKNLNSLFYKCNDYLNEDFEALNFIDLFKYIINDSEKNYILKIKSLSSLSKKSIFKFTIAFKDKKKDLYFYGNTRINEINHYLNNNLKDFKNNDVYFKIVNKDDKIYKNNKSLDEYDSNITLNELKTKGQLEIINKEIISKDKLLDYNNNLTERFNSILINWFKLFSKGKNEMIRADIADCFNK